MVFTLMITSKSFSQNSLDSSEIPETALYKLDTSIFRGINNNRSQFLDFYIPIIDKSVFPVTVVTPIAMFTFGKINKVSYDENSALLLGLSEASGFGITYLLKNIIKRKRPFKNLKDVYSKSSNSFTDEYSFPSSHTTMAFALATSLTLRYNDEPFLIGGLYLYALSVGYGRIYLGTHYPSDVLAGALIGAGTSALIFSLRKDLIKAKNNIFGTEDITDRSSKNSNGYYVLGSVIAVDFLNYLLSKSDNKILSNSKLSININRVGMQVIF